MQINRALLVAGWLLTAALAAAPGLHAQAPIAIGLVRDDGHLIPIALIGPELFEELIPPSTLVNGKPVEPDKPRWPFAGLSWTLFERGRETTPLRTLTSLTVDSHCVDQAVWSTTLKRPPARQHVFPVQKLGIAASGIAVEFPENVTNQPDQGSQRAARRIVALFESKEKARLAQEEAPLTASAAGRPAAVQIQLLVRHTVARVSTYYFEATRNVTLGDGRVVADVGLVTGWIVDSPSGLTDHDVTYKINDDSYKENDRAQVHGIIAYRGRALWLLEWHGYESEHYALHDWPSGNLLLAVDGGGC